MKVAVYIMSCDNTKDVLDHFIKSFEKYWLDCPYDIYIGSNSQIYNSKYNYINVPISGWKNETLEQLNYIKKQDSSITHLIVFLDDFILNRNIDSLKLNSIIDACNKIDLKYLRLKKIEESMFRLSYDYFKNLTNPLLFYSIRKSHPYYSSLQVAIWDINYLESLVFKCKNIWNFEQLKSKDYKHLSVKESIFSYKHVVEKGLWEFYAKDYCIKYINYFNQSDRMSHNKSFARILYFVLKRLKFLFLGYIKFTK